MTESRIPAAGARVPRIVRVQAHVSGCLIVGGLLFVRSGWLLLRPSKPAWPGAGVVLVVAGVTALGIAFLPWVWPRLTVARQRLFTWVVLALASAAATRAMFGVDLGAIVGIQAVLAGLVLSEVGGRRHALRWFWVCVAAIAVTVVAYYLLVPPRLTPD